METRFLKKNAKLALEESKCRQHLAQKRLEHELVETGYKVINDARSSSEINMWILSRNAELESVRSCA